MTFASHRRKKTFPAVEENLNKALVQLKDYYTRNHLRANPEKTQTCAFHLKHREANRPLDITWSGTRLPHCPNPKYLGVTLDRTLTYKLHIQNTKAKVNTRNNILRKLTTSKWGACPRMLRTSALALCYSAAEYAYPVWERSCHAKKLDPALNNSCRHVTGYLKPTNTNNVHVLAGIAPPDIRRKVASSEERLKQTSDEKHILHGQQPATRRLKSRKCFLSHTLPLNSSKPAARLQMWKDRFIADPSTPSMNICPAEALPPGAGASWLQWKSLNRLRTGVGRSKVDMAKWGYHNGPVPQYVGAAPSSRPCRTC